MTLKPMLAEAAPRGRSTFDRQLADVDFPTHILLSEGAARRGGDLFALYNEMEEKDGHLFSVLQTRKTGVLARERKLLPASETDADRRVADFVDDILDCIPQFPQALFNILDALGKGFSVQEIVWTYRDDGRVGVAGLKSRWPGRFCFDRDERLRLLDSPTSAQWLAALGGFDSGRLEAASRPLPERKFLVFTFGGQYGNSYGKGLCARAYWYYWFKKNNLKFWGLYNEKFGAPTVVAKYQHGVTEEERRRLMEVLESLQSDAGVAIPENITLEFLEARNSDGGATYQALGDWCNDEMAKIVLGQTLTSGEGRRSGSLALGQVHADVRREYIESDARDLMAVINGQLIPWIVAFNFPAGTPSPRWIIDPADEPDLAEELKIDTELIRLGVPLSADYFYERYRRRGPRAGERALSFDDQNLFQYHIRYGVLTINEVRQRLGLPEAPWGRVRAGDLPAAPSQGASTPEGSLERAAQPHEQEAPES